MTILIPFLFVNLVLFVVVNGVPSVGAQVMVGSGQIETQKSNAAVDLPSSSIPGSSDSDNTPSSSSNSDSKSSAALPVRNFAVSLGLLASALVLGLHILL